MANRKFLVLFRSERPASDTPNAPPPSPEQMQQMFAAYNAWKEQFKAEILDMGDKLKAGGRIVTASGVVDGPFVESKEMLGGYMIITAADIDRAVEVVQACPAVHAPGARLEVREMFGASM